MSIPQKTFRVFVSSTFTDMREERRILQKDVFPRLKTLCENKGATFQDIDLRWGVNEGAQLDHKTMDICIGEIARCQQLSPKPNFIILLGDKYGWQPVPARIPGDEMVRILDLVFEDDKNLLTEWYGEDTNAIPPEYVLQPRGAKYHKYEDWCPIEERLREILRNGAAKLPFTDEQAAKYFTSATHQEILSGALNPVSDVINPEEHVFAYLRTIRGLPEDERGKDYIDLVSNKRDLYSKNQLEKLKEDLCKKLSGKHIYQYEVNWGNDNLIDKMQAFGDRVYKNLSSIIESQLQGNEEIDSLTHEIEQHEAFKNERLNYFIGREDALREIQNYLRSSSKRVLSIIGASGIGKTSIIAKAIDEASQKEGVIVYRFIGRTSTSSEPFHFLTDIIREIALHYNINLNSFLKEQQAEQKLSSLEGLRTIFPLFLNLANRERPLVIFLDALDQLSRNIDPLQIDWLPEEIPENVKIVVSILPESRKKINHYMQYNLTTMTFAEGEQLLESWLASVRRTLQPDQRDRVMQGFSINGNPLFLKLAFEKARNWYSFLENTTIKTEIDGLLDDFFDELERKHGCLLVQKVCGYILSGKYEGLMEQEILDILIFDQEYWDLFIDECHQDHRQEVQEMKRIPTVVWSRLYFDLEPYLTMRQANGSPILSFYHRKFMDYVSERYLSSSSFYYHSNLADYFEIDPQKDYNKWIKPLIFMHNFTIDTDKILGQCRKFHELPWQLQKIENYEKLFYLIADPIFLYVTYFYNKPSIYFYWSQIEKKSDFRMTDAYKQLFDNKEEYYSHKFQYFLSNDEQIIKACRGIIEELFSRMGHKDALNALVDSRIQNETDEDHRMIWILSKAIALYNNGSLDEALDLINQCDKYFDNLLSSQLNNVTYKQILANVRNVKGLIFYKKKDLDKSIKILRENESFIRKQADNFDLDQNLVNQSHIFLDRGDYDNTLKLLREAEVLIRETGDKDKLWKCLANIGVCLRLQGKLDDSLKVHGEQEDLCVKYNFVSGLISVLGQKALVMKANGNVSKAIELFQEQEDRARKANNSEWLQFALSNQESIRKELNDFDKKNGIATSLKAEANRLQNKGIAKYNAGNMAEALSLFQEQERIYRRVGDMSGLQSTLNNLACVYRKQGDLDRAMALHKEQENISRENQLPYGIALSLYNQAEILAEEMDHIEDSLPLAREALQIFSQLYMEDLKKQTIDFIRKYDPGSNYETIITSQEEENMADDLITSENLTNEFLKSVYEAAFMETKIDQHGHLLVKDASNWLYVFPSKDMARIQLLAAYGSKEGSNRTDLVEFANRVNREYIMIRTTIQDNGQVFFDHDINVSGGITKKALVFTTKRFFNIPNQAIQSHGSGIF